jgi:hypothetical protein
MKNLIEILDFTVRDYSHSEEAKAHSINNQIPESGSGSSIRPGEGGGSTASTTAVFNSAGVSPGS